MKLFENIYAASKKPNSDNCNQICLPAALVLGQAIPFKTLSVGDAQELLLSHFLFSQTSTTGKTY